MTTLSLVTALLLGSTGFAHGGGIIDRCYAQRTGGFILGPGPGYGWGYPNGNPDEYGYYDLGDRIPLAEGRTAEYHFLRQYSIPPEQMFISTYYNPYISQGQRYVPWTNCGGPHPASNAPSGPGDMPAHPYDETIGTGPRVAVPTFTGRSEAPPINTGSSGLTP